MSVPIVTTIDPVNATTNEDILAAALAAIGDAVRLHDYDVAKAALRPIRELVACGGCKAHELRWRLTAAMADAGVPGSRAGSYMDWLERHTADEFSDWQPPADDNEEIVVRTEPGTLEARNPIIEDALIAARFGLYQQGGRLVRIAEGGPRTDPRMVLTEVDEWHLLELLNRCIRWEKPKNSRDTLDTVRIDCPVSVARAYIARRGIGWGLPELKGVIHSPMLREDGSVLHLQGYDPRIGLYIDTRGQTFPRIPERPDRAAAADAIMTLWDLLEEYRFVSMEAGTVALAAILTAVIRPSLPSAPLFAFTAPAPGTGKSHLVNVVSLIATGKLAKGLTWTGDEQEDRKQLDSELLAGASMIVLDNVTRPLGGARLNQLLTEQAATVRVLGQSKTIEVSCGALVLANGNNLTVAADMTRRTLLCSLDAEIERPEEREFECDPHGMIRESRGKYIAAALTVLRAYHVAGRPNRPKPLGSFEAWSDLVRGALIWLEQGDPVASMQQVRENDPVRNTLVEVMESWDAALGCRTVTTKDLTDAALSDPGLRDALMKVAGDRGAPDTRKLGTWLGKVKNQIVGGKALRMAMSVKDGAPVPAKRGGVQLWRLAGGSDVPERQQRVAPEFDVALPN